MEQSSPPLSPQTETRLEANRSGRTMNVGLLPSRDSNEALGMSLSESDSDDENSLSSTHHTPESPPDGPIQQRANRNRLFGRGRRARREVTATGVSADAANTDSGRPSSATRPRRGLFRRRRGRNDRSGEEPRRWRRPVPGVGMSLSDTESRPLRADVDASRRARGARGSAVGRSSIHVNEKGQSIERSFHGVARGNGSGGGSGGGGASGKDAFLHPAPQPLHRYRSTGQAEEEYRLSQDPDFFPPIPLADNVGEGTDRPSSRGQVRYGDYIRLWGYSSYEQKAGYVGYLRRTTRKRNSVGKGELFVLPPVPPSRYSIFHESCFKIVAPQAEREDSEVVCFGEEISLVDDRGMVWNNKDGRHHGRLGPSLFGNGGHMQLKFLKRVGSAANGDQSAMSAPALVAASPEIPRRRLEGGAEREGEGPISYGDTCLLVAKKIRPRRDGVVRAPVTHFRRRRQTQLGGYLRSDGKGFACTFTIHHAPPRISMVTVYSFSAEGTVTDTHTHYKISWNQELEFELPVEAEWGRGLVNGEEEQESPDDDGGSSLPVLRVNLSNGGEMALRARDVKICEDKTVWFDVIGLADPLSILAQSRRQMEAGEGGKDKKIVSIELLSLGGVLVTFSLAKALAARAPRLFFSWELPIALEVSLDVLISLMMLLVALRQKGVPAALSHRVERSNSVKYAIKLIKCESGAAQEKPAGDGSGEAEDIPPMPDSFLLAECGDYDKAYARWKQPLIVNDECLSVGDIDVRQVTVKWRQESGANVALATPHPRFDLIKKQYPTYFHGKDKTGAVIYYEQLGKIDDEELRRVGLDSKQMLWHYMYQMEYLWSVINPVDSDRCTTVLDLKGVSLATAAKAEIMLFIKQAVTMMSTHYPERSTHVILISLPRWFDWIFRFVRPLLSESTKSKISSCTAANVYQTLLSKIDNDQIPREYGGASEHGLGEHPYEVGMRENALRVLAEHNMTVESLEEIVSSRSG